VPVAAAHLLQRWFKITMAWSVLFAMLSVLAGLFLSFHLDIAPGGTIVMTAIGIYLCVMLARKFSEYKTKMRCHSTFLPRHQEYD